MRNNKKNTAMRKEFSHLSTVKGPVNDDDAKAEPDKKTFGPTIFPRPE